VAVLPDLQNLPYSGDALPICRVNPVVRVSTDRLEAFDKLAQDFVLFLR
jgi:hypothetical protein